MCWGVVCRWSWVNINPVLRSVFDQLFMADLSNLRPSPVQTKVKIPIHAQRQTLESTAPGGREWGGPLI